MEHAFEFGSVGRVGKPSIFDISAQESTKALLYPLLQHMLRVRVVVGRAAAQW